MLFNQRQNLSIKKALTIARQIMIETIISYFAQDYLDIEKYGNAKEWKNLL